MKTITITLTGKSLDTAIKDLKAYEKDCERKAQELTESLANIGEREAIIGYSMSGNGNTDISVAVQANKDGHSVIASGEDVLFAEFGTGVYTDTTHEWAGKVPKEIAPGSWSKDHAQLFTTKGHWYYAGVPLEGTEPTRAMYYAFRRMVDSVKREAERIFR